MIFVQAKLLHDGLQRALLNSSDQCAHIFKCGIELLLGVVRVVDHLLAPAVLPVEDANGEEQRTGRDLARWVNQHSLLDEAELAQVLRQEEERVVDAYKLGESLQEEVRRLDRDVELERVQNRHLHFQDLLH